MKQVSINIEEDLVQAMKVPASEVQKRLKRELAVRLYEKGLLTFGKARELAEMSRWAFHDLLGEEGIERRYDMEELENDVKILEELG
jgi:predicted HTH domain antitoxin